jgi:hypothetical protein
MINFEKLFEECYEYREKNILDDFEMLVELDLKGERTSHLTWGITDLESIREIFSSVRPPRRLVVAGCSIGYQCFIWNQMFPDIPCVGIELHEKRVKWGANMIQKYGIENVQLYIGDYTSLQIENGDLIWQNNLMFRYTEIEEYNIWAMSNFDVEVVSYIPLHVHMSNYAIVKGQSIAVPSEGQYKQYNSHERLVKTSWTIDQDIYYHYLDRPFEKSFGPEHVDPKERMLLSEIGSYDTILKSRTRIDSDTMRHYSNKNEAKKLFIEVGLNVPELILYTTEKKDITEILQNLDSFVAKPVHWSESVDVHIKHPGYEVDCVEISDLLNKRIEMSDMYNWRRMDIEEGIPYKNTEKGTMIEQYIDVVYELKVFVVFGDPIICDLRTGSTEMSTVDFIMKNNKYLNWENEYELICELAKRIGIDFFRIDMLYDGERLYANELTFMPGTYLPEHITELISNRIKNKYIEYYKKEGLI